MKIITSKTPYKNPRQKSRVFIIRVDPYARYMKQAQL